MTSPGEQALVDSASLEALFEEALIPNDHRARSILSRRTFADSGETLEELGREFRVSRERIRQLEEAALGALRESPIVRHARAAAEVLYDTRGFACALTVALEKAPQLAEVVPTVGQPLWRVLERVDRSFEVADSWWCWASAREARSRTRDRLAFADRSDGVVPPGDLEGLGIVTGDVYQWLAFCGVKTHEGYALLNSASIPERAALTLEACGSPLTGDEIAARFEQRRSGRSVLNAMSVDDRFVRVDRYRWALRKWGLPEYMSIRELIEAELDAVGGAIRLTSLVTKLTAQFSISERSIEHYASVPPFETAAGMVGYRSKDPTRPRKTPFQTRRMFRLPSGWAIRTDVTRDHERGSGSTLPLALSSVLELTVGETATLVSRLGPQPVGWNGAQLSLGSIRRFVEESALVPGDVVFLIFSDERVFDVRRLPAPPEGSFARAFALAGVSLCIESPTIGHLAEAIGLSAAARVQHVIERLRERGDYDIVDCLPRGEV